MFSPMDVGMNTIVPGSSAGVSEAADEEEEGGVLDARALASSLPTPRPCPTIAGFSADPHAASK